MTDNKIVRVGFIGAGNMARHHIKTMLTQPDTTEVVAICEPSATVYHTTAALFTAAGLTPPPNLPDLMEFLGEFKDELDAVFIITPHVYHYQQAKACLEAGLHVLLEKPMVMNAEEARHLIDVRDQTGKLLVVAFNGGLSPHIRTAVKMLRSGDYGPILNISGLIWQNWISHVDGTWRVQPEISGGGFMFDSGAHLLNTVSDLAGENFSEVAAWLDNGSHQVETRGVIMGRLESGALVTLHGCGEAPPSCSSDIKVFTPKAIFHLGAWGGYLNIQQLTSSDETFENHTFQPVPVPPSLGGAWEQFLAVYHGEIENPCPPEVGLRMARLWDAIRASAAQGGIPVNC